jgi:hypothetical protein
METVSLADQVKCTSDTEKRNAQVAGAMARGLPLLEKQEAHGRRLAIVGGGPSVIDHLDDLRGYDDIWCVNGALGWLLENGVKPTGYVAIDPEAIMAQYLQNPPEDITYYIGSVCDPATFDALKDRKVILFHPLMDDMPLVDGKAVIGGGPTVLTRAPQLAYRLGYRDVHLFGADSSYEFGIHHIYDAPMDPILRVSLDDIIYETSGVFLHQVAYFQQILHWFQSKGANFEIHGRGLGPAILKAKMHTTEEAIEKADREQKLTELTALHDDGIEGVVSREARELRAAI